jgi:transposase
VILVTAEQDRLDCNSHDWEFAEAKSGMTLPIVSGGPTFGEIIFGRVAGADRRWNSRTGEGRERAKARGVRFGRPKKLTAHQRREALDRIAAGEAVAEVARPFGVGRATVYRLKPWPRGTLAQRGASLNG